MCACVCGCEYACVRENVCVCECVCLWGGGWGCKCVYIIVLLLGKIFIIVINPIIKERKFTQDKACMPTSSSLTTENTKSPKHVFILPMRAWKNLLDTC